MAAPVQTTELVYIDWLGNVKKASATGVPPVPGHGQDGHGTEGDTALCRMTSGRERPFRIIFGGRVALLEGGGDSKFKIQHSRFKTDN